MTLIQEVCRDVKGLVIMLFHEFNYGIKGKPGGPNVL